MRLKHDEMKIYEEKKKYSMLDTIEIATMLIITPEDLFRCSVGNDVHPEVVQAVREWIAE